MANHEHGRTARLPGRLAVSAVDGAAPEATTPASVPDPALVEPALLVAALKTDLVQGLTTAEAQRRLETGGPNELRSRPPEPLWHRVLRQFQDPLVYLLLVAMAISLVAWILEGATGAPVDVIVIGLIVVANAVIGLVQESKAESAVAALSKLTAATASVVRDGLVTTVPARELVRGDLLVLSEGDAVGADARVVEASGLRVQEASLTGESVATTKDAQTLERRAALGDRHNMVFKGTGVVQGVGRAIVTATGLDTQLGAIAEMLDETTQETSPLQKEIAQVSRLLGLLVIAIAIVVMGTLFLTSTVRDLSDVVTILLLGVSLAVAAVPEGLPAILSLVLAIGVQAMARRNAVMKNLHSVETLGAATVICSDKTGTLTRNEMTLVRIVTASGSLQLSGTGYRPDGEVVGDPSDEVLAEAGLLLVAGSVANHAQLHENATTAEWEVQGDPTEASFLVAQLKLHGSTERVDAHERRAEVPFTSERKMMSVLGRDAEGDHRLFTKGAPDILLQHCSFERRGDQVEALHDGRREAISRTIAELSRDGFRTLGVSYRTVDSDGLVTDDLDGSAEEDLVLLGIVGIIDPPREEAAEAIAEAHRAGIRTVMITGDHPATAVRIAADLGLSTGDEIALTGDDLDALDDEQLKILSRDVHVYARVSPRHKLRIIDALHADGEVVAMTGDGVNDAPALKAADIGIAMGITGTEVTKDASRMVLADDNYATIVAAVRHGRGIYDNIAKFLRYLLSSNFGEVVTVFFGVVLAGVIGLQTDNASVVLPLLATQILWINLVTDSGPALAMGVDPEDGDLMTRQPRPRDARILDRAMWGRVVVIGFVMGAVTLLAIDLHLPGGLIEGHDSIGLARTAGFTTLVLAQLFNALNSRSHERSAFSHLFDNRWLWVAIVVAILLQVAVVEIPVLQVAFGTESLGPFHWLVAAALGSTVLWVDELLKLVMRRRSGGA